MWEFIVEYHNRLLGLATAIIWTGAIIWFLYLNGYLVYWRDQWRERRKRQTW